MGGGRRQPFGLGGTVTAGIISAEGRESSPARIRSSCKSTRRSTRAIPVVRPSTSEVEVVGVNTEIFRRRAGSVGLGSAIPARTVDLWPMRLSRRHVDPRLSRRDGPAGQPGYRRCPRAEIRRLALWSTRRAGDARRRGRRVKVGRHDHQVERPECQGCRRPYPPGRVVKPGDKWN